MTSRKRLLLVLAGTLTAGGIAAAATSHLWIAVALNLALGLFVVVLQLQALNREELRHRRIDRVEKKLDAAARRLITESESLAEQIRTEMRRAK